MAKNRCNKGLEGIHYTVVHRRRIKTEEKAKFITVVLGDVLECHLAARMIFKNVFGRKITFGRVVVWYGV